MSTTTGQTCTCCGRPATHRDRGDSPSGGGVYCEGCAQEQSASERTEDYLLVQALERVVGEMSLRASGKEITETVEALLTQDAPEPSIGEERRCREWAKARRAEGEEALEREGWILRFAPLDAAQ